MTTGSYTNDIAAPEIHLRRWLPALGGILMNAEQTVVFLGALGFFLMRLLDEESERSG